MEKDKKESNLYIGGEWCRFYESVNPLAPIPSLDVFLGEFSKIYKILYSNEEIILLEKLNADESSGESKYELHPLNLDVEKTICCIYQPMMSSYLKEISEIWIKQNNYLDRCLDRLIQERLETEN